jgi:putative ABC transport system permease protein
MSWEMYSAKNELFLKGTNAVLTLSFLSIAAITIIGFLIYWIISLKSRALQFGVYRSLGISSKGISSLAISPPVS